MYPSNPPGLRWEEHYTMANGLFYAVVATLESGGVTPFRASPDPLPEGEQPPTRKHQRGREIRAYKSQYVGVTTHNKRYVSQWGKGGRWKGSVQPMTPDGERLAALERAVALELDYIERRDGNHEPL